MFQSLNHVDVTLKPQILTKSGYYTVPSPSSTLLRTLCCVDDDDAIASFYLPFFQMTFNQVVISQSHAAV